MDKKRHTWAPFLWAIMFILMDGAVDTELIEESQGVFSVPPNHIGLEIATRQQSVKQAMGAPPSVPAVEVWHPTGPDLV